MMKMMHLTIALLLPAALSMTLQGSANFSSDVETPKLTLSVVDKNVQEISEMEKVFVRSDEAHLIAMDEMSQTITFPKAMEVLEKSTLTQDEHASLKRIASLISSSGNLRTQNDHDVDGFGGLDGARKLLNDMIHESATKYDAEVAKCVDYYSKQCAIMEVARGQIAAANFIAATSRALILDAQGNINKAQVSIPETKQELKDHNVKCANELKKMNARLKIILGDIEILTMILEMSDCDANLLQTNKLAMLRCQDKCTMKNYVTFNNNKLQREMNQLNSSVAQDLIAQAFADFFDDGEPADSMQFVQVAGSDYQELVAVPKKKDAPKKSPKTKFNNPPLPQTAVPSNPCTDPNAGAPSAANKRAAKCTLKKSPRCYKLQGRFLQIQAGVSDDRDQLMEDIQKLEDSCEETKKTLEASIENDENILSTSQTKLAEATQKEASAGETGRQVAKENEQYHKDLTKQMKSCSDNYVGFESEICALKKIRGDLFKKKVAGHSGFFQDCELSPWSPEACTKKCAGGEQKLIRKVMQHPNGGAKCLPLAAKKSCNTSPCPVNCAMAQWSGWSKCSSKCGGGVSTRVRDVKVAMKYGGKPCGAVSMTKQCNVQSCEKDCSLGRWTFWTRCSKDCDGGTRKRVRFVKEPALGSGKCAGKWSKDRLQYRTCNMRRCRVPDPKEALKCKSRTPLDVILLLDATPKSGKDGWDAEVKAANLFVDAFQGKGVKTKPNFAVIHYTGPRTWSGVSKCTGKSKKKVDMEKTCKIKIASHFSGSISKTKSTISGLQYQPGSKLLSLALMTTQSELALGRKTARTVVVVFIDGEPLSYRNTMLGSRAIRKKARLVWVPVAKFAPLKNLKKWATRRWQENLVTVDESKDWASPTTVTHIVANICPKRAAKLRAPKRGKR